MTDDSAIANYIEEERRQRTGNLFFFGHRTKLLPLEIGELTWLTNFKFSDSNAESLIGVENLINLENINFAFTEVRDLSPLQNLTKLSEITFNNTKVDNLYPLNKLRNLESIDCSGCDIETDAPFLCTLPKLKHLRFNPAKKVGLAQYRVSCLAKATRTASTGCYLFIAA